MRTQLGAQHVAGFARKVPGPLWVFVPDAAEDAHRRQAGESLAEALDAAALVVDANQQRRGLQRADVGGERSKLRRVAVVAREQDHAADQRVGQPPAVFVGERGARHVEHQGAQGHGVLRSGRKFMSSPE